MDGESINFVLARYDTIPIPQDNVQTFIDNLGIKIDFNKLSIALCHRSFVNEHEFSEKINLKFLEALGKSLVNLITKCR